MHNSWITKIKYYPDLQYIISSSLDSLIHIHDIDLKYKQKTFNLHQKGVNSFYYSRKHKFVASCGEERHVIIWNPYTRRVVTYLYGHNTSVQDLAMNEERHHLISLGTDKVVNIWDKTFNRIQTIFDKVQYRLTSIVFDPWTNNILLGSRKINAWNFHTQEEIKTSHELPVVFALNNIDKFESVISADDGGFVSVWDIENGKLLFKFGDTHGEKGKITAGCFDSYQRRLVTAGKDGTVKMWNFSNGSKLKDMLSAENPRKVDTEITSLVCICDPDKPESLKDSHIMAVGWDRKIHQWGLRPATEGTEEEEIVSKPQNQAAYGATAAHQQGHKADIMSAVYCRQHGLLYTGGHDGTLFAWSFDTGSIKKTLHDADPSCTSKDYIRESKSVDQLVIMEKVGKLVSMTADQMLRFWSTDELSESEKQPTFKFHCQHPEEDNLTAIAVSEANDVIVTGDTSGQMKMWDVKRVDFDDQKTEKFFIEKYFIVAHRGLINQISVCEAAPGIIEERLIISASNDCNINLHRLRDGVKIGQFGQASPWNLKDMSGYDKKRPSYVRQWYLQLRARMYERKKLREAAEEAKVASEEGQVADKVKAAPVAKKAPTKEITDPMVAQIVGGQSVDEFLAEAGMGGSDDEKKERLPQEDYNDYLADNIEFSDDEQLQDLGYITNAAQYLQPPQGKGKKKNTEYVRQTEKKYIPYFRHELQALPAFTTKGEVMKSNLKAYPRERNKLDNH